MLALMMLCGSTTIAVAQPQPPAAQVQPPAAQPSPPAAQPPARDKEACSQEQLQKSGELPPSDKTLSQRLADTRGVICPPPAVDPEIQAPAPGGGTMKVIPPPGSRGDSDLKPK
jgi:hypothetical protein